MRKFYLALLAVFFQLVAFSQTDIVIGTGTTGNTGTTYPCPLQDYWEGSRAQYLFLASELSGAGMTAGTISSIKYEVTALNAFAGSIEQFAVSIGTTTTGTLSATSWEPGTSSVYGPVDFVPVVGTNEIIFTTPFVWNGTDNIIVEVCNGDPNNATAVTYTENVSVPWTTGLSFNGSHTYRTDNLGNLCGTTTTTNNGTQTTRPNITFSWSPSSTTGCYLPSGISVSNVTSSTADAMWNPPTVGSTVATYRWEARSSGAPGSGTTGLAASGSTALTMANIASLSPATTYQFYVRSMCTTGDSSNWSSGYSFLTNCVAINAFSENFDATPISSLPVCWSSLIRGATTPPAGATVSTTTGNAYSAPNSVAMYNAGAVASDDIILIGPALSNLGAGTYRLTFYAKNTDATQDIEVGTLDNNTATATFTALQTIDVTTNYQKFIVDFSTFTGTDQHIGFRRLNTTANFNYVYIDNVVWEPIPACAEPTGLMHANVTATDVELSWTPPSTGSPIGYHIYYSTNRTTPPDTTTNYTSASASPYTLGGLAPSTKYFVWVRTNCGVGSYSPWSVADSFNTLCVAVTDFSENFDGITPPVFPNCWSKVGTGGLANTQTGSPNSAPNTLYIYGTSATNRAVVAMPAVSNADSGTHQLKFSMRGNFTAGDAIDVGYLTDPTDPASFVLIQSFTAATLTYQPYTVIPSGLSLGSSAVFAFRHAGNIGYSILIDDVSWAAIPGCLEPTDVMTDSTTITDTSATIFWTAPTPTPNSYSVYYNTTGVAPTGSTVPNITGVTGTSVNLTGLSPATTYYVWVKSDCGTTGMSTWSVAGVFTTACSPGALNIPYTQNFEGASVPSIPTCTIIENAGTGNNWITSNAPGYGFTTKTLQYTYSTPNAANAWFYTPGLNLTAGVSYRLSFLYGNNSTTYTEKLEVKYGISPSSADMNDLIMSDTSINIQDSVTSVTDFVPATTGVYFIGFHAFSDADQFYLFVDNINLDLTTTVPVELNSFTGVRDGSVNMLNWTTATESANVGFEIQRSADGRNFSKIGYTGTKALNGNSSSALNYSFADTKPFIGASYYRLKQTDKDGRFNLSSVVLVKGIRSNELLLSNVYPNPASDKLNVVLNAPANQKISFVLTDLAGKIVMSEQRQLLNGDNNVILNISKLPSGSYMLKAVCGNGCETAVRKVVKQ